VHEVNVVMQQTAVYTAEPPVSEPSGSEVGMASGNRKRYKPPVNVHVATELSQAEGYILKGVD